MITKKKRSLKRLYRVKSSGRGRVKSRGRGRGRFRKHTMRGGLGPHDGVNIKITDRFSFANPQHIDELALFTFGTPSQRAAWTRLLEKCLEKTVPVYILTAGNRVGIIRTLQLLNMDHYFTEVLGTFLPENRMTELMNPRTKSRDFQGMSKYYVIYEIIRELSISDPSVKTGCLLDDDLSNQANSGMAPKVEFLHTKSSENPSDYDEARLRSNVFYNLRITMRGKPNKVFNFTPISLIDQVTTNVDNGTYNIVFIDFDETFQLYDAALPLQNPQRLANFSSVDRTITVT